MKVLVINGSPNARQGGTYKTTEFIRKALVEKGVTAFEEIFLSELNQPYCDGCLSCLKNGGETCPLIAKVAPLESAICNADAIVIASPVHSFNLSAMTKTMIDLFVREIHRPSFFGKKAVVVAVAYGGGQYGVLRYLRNVLRQWGMDVVGRLGVSSAQLGKPEYDGKVQDAANKLAEKLIATVQEGKEPSPSLIDMISFQVMRTVIDVTREQVPRDFTYWNERGWLTADYFNNAPINPVKNILAKFVGHMIRRSIRRGNSKPIQ
jgi:multimeric flavodoxin WrbA